MSLSLPLHVVITRFSSSTRKGVPSRSKRKTVVRPSRRSQSAICLARTLAVVFSLGSCRAGKAGARENRQRGNQRKHVPHGNRLDRHRGERSVDNEDHEENDPQDLPAPDGSESENEQRREKQGSGGASERSLLLHPRQRHFHQDLHRRVNRMRFEMRDGAPVEEAIETEVRTRGIRVNWCEPGGLQLSVDENGRRHIVVAEILSAGKQDVEGVDAAEVVVTEARRDPGVAKSGIAHGPETHWNGKGAQQKREGDELLRPIERQQGDDHRRRKQDDLIRGVGERHCGADEPGQNRPSGSTAGAREHQERGRDEGEEQVFRDGDLAFPDGEGPQRDDPPGKEGSASRDAPRRGCAFDEKDRQTTENAMQQLYPDVAMLRIPRGAEGQESDVTGRPMQGGRPGGAESVPDARGDRGGNLPVAVEVVLLSDRASLREKRGEEEETEEPPREYRDDGDADGGLRMCHLKCSSECPASGWPAAEEAILSRAAPGIA